MNKKAFTLVELLAVIVLLGIVSLIATATVNNELKKTKQQGYEMQIEKIKTGAKTWASDNVFSLPSEDGEYIELTLGQLKQAGFADDVINPLTNLPFEDSLVIRITRDENSYIYEVFE